MTRSSFCLAIALVAGCVSAVRADDVFEKHIRPLLADRCVACHGARKQSGGLRLDSRGAILRGGDSGPAVVPGKPDDSLIVQAVSQAHDLKMPPPPRERVATRDLEPIKTWIQAGLPWPNDGATITAAAAIATPAAQPADLFEKAKSWWSFQPLRAVSPPDHASDTWSKTATDRFILVGLRALNLTPSPPADRRTLIRRASYDLTGLPPSPIDVEAFLRDDRPDAFARVVDRLLASPAYGERWGRHWLDLVRYADTAGENTDRPVPDAWRYRNWVISAFNHDQPYDQFIREQVAGDILAAGGPEELYSDRLVATGFLAIARRFDHDSDKSMHLTYEDTIDTIGKAVLGLTLGCARCHDHKYDPVTSKDYYALYGILQSSRYPFAGCEAKPLPRDLSDLLPPSARARRDAVAAAELARLDAEARLLGQKRKHLAAIDSRLATIDAKRKKLTKPDTVYAVTEGTPADARVQQKGDPQKLGAEVPRRWLAFFGGQLVPAKGEKGEGQGSASGPGCGSGRLELAGWLTDPSNSLTARVIVNRVWLHHFGKGLVTTPNDFGARGRPPTNPALLDWLAAQFIEDGWSIKTLHRRLMLSAVYQQASLARPEAARVDAANDCYWRFDRRRLSAEELRDSLLLAAGALERSPGGPHPFPPPSEWKYTQHNPFSTFYASERRSVYLVTLRNRRPPFFALFDGADPNATTPERQVTTVPTQALFFMNDPFFHAQAEQIAMRAAANPRANEAGRIDALYERVLQRKPQPAERETAAAFVRTYLASLGDADGNAEVRTRSTWSALTRVLCASNEFLYVD